MTARSFFTVLRDGQAIHSETAGVELLGEPVEAGALGVGGIFYCATSLVPTFWSTICQDRGKSFPLHGIPASPGSPF